jgi:Protein of unknown function (DUF1549)/Protein of unknown function (DUF1553)
MARTFVRGATSARAGLLLVGLALAAGFATVASISADAKKPAASARAKKTPAGPSESLLNKTGDADQVHLINQRIAEKWKANKITPSARCNDYEFIRRASLDLIGRIATPKEIEQYLHDPEATRRALLVDRLLKSPEYARNFANLWTVWLMTRVGAEEQGRSIYHEQMHAWLESQFSKEGMSYKELVTELLTAEGKTNQNGAVNYILAHLGEPYPKGEQAKEGRATMVPLTSRTTRLFLGQQVQCAQCHDHPFNKETKQRYFWGINAFFRQVDIPRGRPETGRMAREVVLEVKDNPNLNPTGNVFYEYRSGFVESSPPKYIGAKERANLNGGTRRQALARLITEDKDFPRAFVNRMWMHFFGRGFTNPVDDFGPDNEVSHPELLDELGVQFAHYGYDPRRLMRWICNSEAYSLSSVANKSNEKADAEPFFSRMLLKAMSPEQLFESLIVATQAEMFESKENRKKIRAEWMKHLTSNFGDDEGNEVTFNGTVVQALMMMNGDDINKAISSKDKGTVPVAVVSKRSYAGILDYLYKAALNRPPTPREAAKILEIRKAPVHAASRDALSFWQDVYWAILNSNEFILNH